MIESTNNYRKDWLAQIEQRVQDKVGDQWRSVKLSEFVKDVAWWLHDEKKRDDEDTIEAIAGLIVYGIKTKEDLQNISDEKKEFRDTLESKGVLPPRHRRHFVPQVSTIIEAKGRKDFGRWYPSLVAENSFVAPFSSRRRGPRCGKRCRERFWGHANGGLSKDWSESVALLG